MPQIITRQQLLALIDSLLEAGTKVATPVARGEKAFFQYLEKGDAPLIDPAVFPVNSTKEFFFPRHEILYTFERQGTEVLVTDARPFVAPQVVLGARPCDAAALPLMDRVFGWDFQDRFYQSRRENTTVVSLACAAPDAGCFCTSVDLSPETQAGADAELLPIDDDTFEVRVFTEKGRILFGGKTSESDKTGRTGAAPDRKFDAAQIRERLQTAFETPAFFSEAAVRCLGCGACTYVCPTCHCFDMVDEGSVDKGRKVKNWDSCQFALFTHHASGHNPRHDQGERQRQRVLHKFSIYPEKFGVLLCTGCGNCVRGCVDGLGIRPVLEEIAK
ncbi:MAG TPA: heterodisulfide reductase subunit A [Planctomycetaceae bacterium]|nr:heterodisulfide reductase subunit A [Planctomycetaceae bacterium]